MNVELKVPEIGESITEVEIGEWLKKAGETVGRDEPVVTLESEKATVELPAPETGKVAQVLKKKGEVAKVGEIIGYIEKDGAEAKNAERRSGDERASSERGSVEQKARGDRESVERKETTKTATKPPSQPSKPTEMLQLVPQPQQRQAPPPEPTEPEASQSARRSEMATEISGEREEEVVPMTRLRRTVAERLVAAQHNAALLTSFNEIDMGSVVMLRKEHGESFQKKYDVKLGFMSFFVKAAIDALKQFPVLNAEVRENNIIYHNYYDIGIAVGGGKGLVVPVLRNAERMSFAEIETAIADFARRARENKLKVDELQGGTFTISNGGVYGSLLSTPIVNPPQSGVLGLHAIQDRPVAHEGNVVVRPMMYVALGYDHRIVDGREAVLFLKRIKDVIENPARMLMEI
jgi:2-oxoglutarate dehydrogenase E2 component (dihydrolipoamide succinyltransferase)